MIITFHGADHKCGCSMVSQCCAEAIADNNPKSKVLLVHAEQALCSIFSPKTGDSMERIRPYLAEGLLDEEDVIKRSLYKGNLHIISGTDIPGSSEAFHPDMMVFFLNKMAPHFDVIVCDSGANIEHGLALGALFASDSIYVVLNQNESSFRRYEWLRPLYSKLGLRAAGYVINRFSKNSAYTKEYVRKRLGSSRDSVFTVRDSQYGALAEIDEKSLLSYKDNGFSADLELLASDMLLNPKNSED